MHTLQIYAQEWDNAAAAGVKMTAVTVVTIWPRVCFLFPLACKINFSKINSTFSRVHNTAYYSPQNSEGIGIPRKQRTPQLDTA